MSFVPLGLLTFASLRLASDAVTKDVGVRLRSTAAVGASAVQHEMEGLQQVVGSYAARPTVRRGLAGERPQDDPFLDDALKELKDLRKGVATTFLSDPWGRLIDIQPPTPTVMGDDFSYRDWYKGVIATRRPYVSEVYRSRAAGRPHVVGVAVPVYAPGDGKRLAGIIVVGYSVEAIRTFADVTSSQSGEKIMVVDQRGTIVTAPGGQAQRLRTLDDDPRVRRSLQGDSGLVTEDRGPGGELSSYAPVAGIDWTVIASVDADTAFADIRQLRSVVLTISAALALALCTGLVFLAFIFRARGRAERELRASDSRFVQLIEALPIGLYVMSADGRPYLANHEAQRLLGKGIDPALGPDDLAEAYKAFLAGTDELYPNDALPVVRALRGETTCIEDMEIRRGTTVVPLEVRGAPIYDADGQLLYAIAAFTDITERRNAQRQIEQAKTEAERANLAKSEFLSRMSHELRTPLNAILGFAQLLAMDAKSDDDKEGLGHILKGGQHLLALINEVLDIARIESGTLSFSLEPVDVDELVQEVIDLAIPLANARGVIIIVTSSATDDLHVIADRQRLKQVLLNLFSNAIKYNHERGTAGVCATTGSSNTVRISVSDTGPGIPEDKLDRIFVPFDRLGAEQTDVEGTGIGLALSRALVESMGGTLTIDSTVGAGSTFSVELPLTDSPFDKPVPVPPVSSNGDLPQGSVTVLSIEDNPSNIKLLERIFLQRPNVRLLTAIQGTLGVELATQHQPDLILLDLNLPDIQGVEVLDRLQSDPATSAIPVVVLSADATPGQITRLLAAGARDYLTKPIDVQMCLNVLDEVVADQASRGARAPR